MCGITGIVHAEAARPLEVERLRAMNTTLTHRGPDGAGEFVGRGVGLAMRRLAIIDVAGGQQPVFSADLRIVAVCNGEIYNHRALRAELSARGYQIREGSDAEVIPHAYQAWGVDCLEHLEGMFAVAIWDEDRRSLLLARDRLGKKPIYYMVHNGSLYFGSELKSLRVVTEAPWAIDRRALTRYLSFEYLPAPETIFAGVHKLPAGTRLVWEGGRLSEARYWDIPSTTRTVLTLPEAQQAFREHFAAAIQERLMSDVPLGVFLSGGIDSTSIVAMLRHIAPQTEIKTFAIGFPEASYDESAHAAYAAQYFRTTHHARMVTAATVLKQLPGVIQWLDEPFADDSLLPTYVLSRFAREEVTVALGGDGGDELFAGYQTFVAERWHRCYRHVPAIVQQGIAAAVGRLPVRDTAFSLDFKLRKFIQDPAATLWARHARWVGTSLGPRELTALTGMAYDTAFADLEAMSADDDDALELFYLRYYLPEDILTKVDRASMAASLEVRAPFLDHELVAFCRGLPMAWKLHGGEGKWFLKQALREFLPPAIVQRKKKGFGMPVSAWLRGPLRPMLTDLLAPARLQRQGLLDAAVVQRYLEAHLAGRANHRQLLWTLLIFQLWYDEWGP